LRLANDKELYELALVEPEFAMLAQEPEVLAAAGLLRFLWIKDYRVRDRILAIRPGQLFSSPNYD
jgi:hypothetical protein